MIISQGQRIPWGYAIAFVDVFRDCAFAYPLGWHWVARQWHRIERWRLPYKWTPSERELSGRIRERLEHARYRADGEGYRRGFREGQEDYARKLQVVHDAVKERSE